ncbi:DUF2637 domain-containing protein [Streptomyces sp. NPDC005548]|uniref:DUF2637 domain-containing protein n=1 Tax=Streptomyces sp. NPDC005548 TaxID=3364724 RepID=UPI0036C7B08B
MADSNGERHSTPERDRPQLNTLQRRLVAGVALGAAGIAVIGFIGSYAAVRSLAEAKGFGEFARLFPIGLDVGILVLLALDLLLTWLRMPLGMLRQTAWLLTAATIVFNGAAAWPDPVGVGMHAVIPVLFVVVIEAARHAIGITAHLTANTHMESVRLSRWLLSPLPTFLLWRRMKLWELRSYEQVIALEQSRKIERARLRHRHGWKWRWKAPEEAVMALRLTRYGRPLASDEGAPAVEPAPAAAVQHAPERPALEPALEPAPTVNGAPTVPPPPPAAPKRGAPGRPAPEPEGAPAAPAPHDEGAPPRPRPDEQGAPDDDEPAPEGAPAAPAPMGDGGEERPADEGNAPHPEGADQGDAPLDGLRLPTREDAKRKFLAAWHETGEFPKEGRLVELLKSLDGYPYTSRRHAQKLRDEVKAEERARLERESPNVRTLTGT